MAVLCLVTLVACFVGLKRSSGKVSTAIGARNSVELGGLMAQTPPEDEAPGPANPILLADLVQELRAKATTASTRATTTTTAAKKAATTSTSRPTTTTSKPAAAPAKAATPTTASTTPLTPLTTLLEKVVPPAVAVAGAITKSDSGVASWFNAPDATCAHRTLPMGTMVKVTRTSNGASATCKVNDRGPTLETGRLIDLSLDTFKKLAPKEAGLIDVRIEW